MDETGWDASRGARPHGRGREMPAEVVTSVVAVGRTGGRGEDATMDEATGRPRRVSPPLTPTRGTAAGDVAADARTRGEGGRGSRPWTSPRETRRGRHPPPSSRPGQQGADGPGEGAVEQEARGRVHHDCVTASRSAGSRCLHRGRRGGRVGVAALGGVSGGQSPRTTPQDQLPGTATGNNCRGGRRRGDISTANEAMGSPTGRDAAGRGPGSSSAALPAARSLLRCWPLAVEMVVEAAAEVAKEVALREATAVAVDACVAAEVARPRGRQRGETSLVVAPASRLRPCPPPAHRFVAGRWPWRRPRRCLPRWPRKWP